MSQLIRQACAAIALLLTAMSGVHAQSTVSGSDWSTLLKEVLQHHPNIQTKRMLLEATHQGVEVAKRQYWPTPSVSVDTGPKNFSGEDKALTFRLSIPLYVGTLSVESEIAQLREQRANVDVDLAAREIANELAGLYRLWWQRSAEQGVLAESVHEMAKINAMVQRRADAGVSSRVDALHAQSQLQELKRALAIAEQQKQQALTQINAMTAGPPIALTNASGIPDLHQAPTEVWLARVEDSHPQVTQALIDRSLAQAEVSKARASMQPSVRLKVERQYGSYLGTLGPGKRVSISSDVQFGAGFSAVTQTEQVQAQALAAQTQVRNVRTSLKKETVKLLHEEQNALVQGQNVSQQIQIQMALVEAGLRLFKTGRRSWQELLNLVRDLHRLRMQAVAAQATLLEARWRLEVLADWVPGWSFKAF